MSKDAIVWLKVERRTMASKLILWPLYVQARLRHKSLVSRHKLVDVILYAREKPKNGNRAVESVCAWFVWVCILSGVFPEAAPPSLFAVAESQIQCAGIPI